VLLEVFKGSVGFFCPLKFLLPLEEFEKGETTISQP